MCTFSTFPRYGSRCVLLLLLWSAAVRAQTPQPRNVAFDGVRGLPSHLLVSAQPPLQFGGDIRNTSNFSRDSISGPVVVRYRIGGGPVLGSTTIARLPFIGSANVAWTLPVLPVGDHKLVAWVQLPARYVDTNPADDTVRTTIHVVDAAHTEARLALMKEFTSSTCPPCAPLAATLQQWQTQLPQRNSAVVVAFPQDFPAPGCYYNTPSSTAMGSFSLPTLQVNGRYTAGSLTDPDLHLADELARPAFVHLDAAYYRNPTTGQFTVWSAATPLSDFTGTDTDRYTSSMRLFAAWVEPQVPATNATNGQTVLYHTSHHAASAELIPFPGTSGIRLGAAGGRVALPTLTYTPLAADHVVNLDSLEVVVWLQRYGNQWDPVLQTVRAQRLLAPLANTTATSSALALHVVPNPAAGSATVYLTLQHAQRIGLQVLDRLGRSVAAVTTGELAAGAQHLPLDLRGVAAGLYMVRVTADEGFTTMQRLVVE